MKKNYKVYLNEPTHLTLSDKAQSFCSMTDPLDILEFCSEDEDGEKTYTYEIRGCIEVTDLTEEEVNEILEDYYEEMLFDEIRDNPICMWIEESGIDVCLADQQMDIETAKKDIEEFERSGWNMIEDMTAADYMDAFNTMWRYEKGK